MQIPARGYSGCCALWSCALPAYMEIEHLIRYVHLAVGLMVFEYIIRYPRPTYWKSFGEPVAHDAKKASRWLRT